MRRTTSSASVDLFADSALRIDGPSRILWEHFLSFYREDGETPLDLDEEEALSVPEPFVPPAGIEGAGSSTWTRTISRWSKEALRWVCEDDPYNPNVIRPAAGDQVGRERLPLGASVAGPRGALSVRRDRLSRSATLVGGDRRDAALSHSEDRHRWSGGCGVPPEDRGEASGVDEDAGWSIWTSIRSST